MGNIEAPPFTNMGKADVAKFCEENGIDCYFDGNTHTGLYWTAISIGGKLLFQVDYKATKEQFIKTIQSLKKEYIREGEIEDDGDFWVAVGPKNLFDKFIKKHGKIFEN